MNAQIQRVEKLLPERKKDEKRAKLVKEAHCMLMDRS